MGVAKRLMIPRNQDTKEESHLFGEIELDHHNSETSISDEDLCAFAAFPFDPSKAAEVIIPTLLIKTSPTGETKLIYTGNEEKTKDELLHEIKEINVPESHTTKYNINIDSPVPPEVWRDETSSGSDGEGSSHAEEGENPSIHAEHQACQNR